MPPFGALLDLLVFHIHLLLESLLRVVVEVFRVGAVVDQVRAFENVHLRDLDRRDRLDGLPLVIGDHAFAALLLDFEATLRRQFQAVLT